MVNTAESRPLLVTPAPPTWYWILLSPLTSAVGPVVANNLTALGAFIIAGFGVYWVARGLTGSTAAGLIAGASPMLWP